MKRLFAVLSALVLVVGFSTLAGAQAGTVNGEAAENYSYSDANRMGKSISDSLTWSQSTTTAGRHTKTDTLVGAESDTSITVLNISGAQSAAAMLAYTTKLNGVGGGALACSLIQQYSLDGTNWISATPLTMVSATSGTTT